jgi:hypothetical protein
LAKTASFRWLTAAALPLLIAGCSSWFQSEEQVPPCPRAALVDGADRVVRYAGEGRTPDDVAFEARILGIGGECEFTEEELRVVVDMQLRIEGARGPALQGQEAPLSYFVAVVGPEGQVLAREEFATEIPLERNRAIITEELEPEIPLPEGRRAASYTLFVGLIVSEEELAANRR